MLRASPKRYQSGYKAVIQGVTPYAPPASDIPKGTHRGMTPKMIASPTKRRAEPNTASTNISPHKEIKLFISA